MNTRRNFIIVGLVLVLGLLVAGLPSVAAQGGGANVINGDNCWIYVAPFDAGGPSYYLFPTGYHAVVTPSGNSMLKCTGQLPPDITPPRHAITIKGLGCNVLDGNGGVIYTSDSMNVYTPSGKVQVVCHLNGKSKK